MLSSQLVVAASLTPEGGSLGTRCAESSTWSVQEQRPLEAIPPYEAPRAVVLSHTRRRIAATEASANQRRGVYAVRKADRTGVGLRESVETYTSAAAEVYELVSPRGKAVVRAVIAERVAAIDAERRTPEPRPENRIPTVYPRKWR